VNLFRLFFFSLLLFLGCSPAVGWSFFSSSFTVRTFSPHLDFFFLCFFFLPNPLVLLDFSTEFRKVLFTFSYPFSPFFWPAFCFALRPSCSFFFVFLSMSFPLPTPQSSPFLGIIPVLSPTIFLTRFSRLFFLVYFRPGVLLIVKTSKPRQGSPPQDFFRLLFFFHSLPRSSSQFSRAGSSIHGHRRVDAISSLVGSFPRSFIGYAFFFAFSPSLTDCWVFVLGSLRPLQRCFFVSVPPPPWICFFPFWPSLCWRHSFFHNQVFLSVLSFPAPFCGPLPLSHSFFFFFLVSPPSAALLFFRSRCHPGFVSPYCFWKGLNGSAFGRFVFFFLRAPRRLFFFFLGFVTPLFIPSFSIFFPHLFFFEIMIIPPPRIPFSFFPLPPFPDVLS